MSEVSTVSGLFLVCNTVNLHKCVCPLNSLLNRKPLFSSIILNVNNLRNQNINYRKDNFGKSVQVLSDSEKGSEFLIT